MGEGFTFWKTCHNHFQRNMFHRGVGHILSSQASREPNEQQNCLGIPLAPVRTQAFSAGMQSQKMPEACLNNGLHLDVNGPNTY